jgi:hypothetical protein
MPSTILPPQTTQPPSSLSPESCAYAHLLDRISVISQRQGSLALAAAMALDDCEPSCRAALAERLYDAVRLR